MLSDAAEREGALLCAEGLALLQSSQGDPGAARAVFAEVSQAWPPSARLLREWALFEKRQGRLQVRLCVHHLRIPSTWLFPWLVRLVKALLRRSPDCGCSTSLQLRSSVVCLPRWSVPIVLHFWQEAADLFAEAAAENPQDGRTWMGAALLARRRNMWQVCLPPHNRPASCTSGRPGCMGKQSASIRRGA